MGRKPEQEVHEEYKKQYSDMVKIWMKRAARIAVKRWLDKKLPATQLIKGQKNGTQ